MNDKYLLDMNDYLRKAQLFEREKKLEVEYQYLNNVTAELAQRTALYLELMAATFMKEIGVPASELELVMSGGWSPINPGSFQYRWGFQRRRHEDIELEEKAE